MEYLEKTKAFYSIADLETRWGVSRWTIYRLAREGRLKTTRIRGAVRFSEVTVSAFEKKAGEQRLRSESNRRITVLQTVALPLGYGATRSILMGLPLLRQAFFHAHVLPSAIG
jgi:excisionase family DNA binding protein